MMNKSLLFFFALLSISGLQGQNWLTDYDTALQSAKDSEQNILMVFEGSDWCAPCRKLEKKILKSEEFGQYAESNLVLLKVDFPRRKKNQLSEEQQAHNNNLAEKYNPQGLFPTVVIIDSEEVEKGRLGYEKVSPKEYVQKIKSVLGK